MSLPPELVTAFQGFSYIMEEVRFVSRSGEFRHICGREDKKHQSCPRWPLENEGKAKAISHNMYMLTYA
jgi:hypothetical protein